MPVGCSGAGLLTSLLTSDLGYSPYKKCHACAHQLGSKLGRAVGAYTPTAWPFGRRWCPLPSPALSPSHRTTVPSGSGCFGGHTGGWCCVFFPQHGWCTFKLESNAARVVWSAHNVGCDHHPAQNEAQCFMQLHLGAESPVRHVEAATRTGIIKAEGLARSVGTGPP